MLNLLTGAFELVLNLLIGSFELILNLLIGAFGRQIDTFIQYKGQWPVIHIVRCYTICAY